MKTISFIVASLLFTCIANGQDAGTAEADSTKGNLAISGFLDSYYSYNTNSPGALGSWGTGGVGRIFDGMHNQIAFNMIQTKMVYTSNKIEVVGDLLFGPGAELANFGNTGTAFSIKQAYLAYAFNDKLTFTVGQYGTHIGYELVDSPDNFNYSLSYLFGNGPFYHTGAKIDYAVSDKLAFMAGILNGWDNLIDNNLAKSYALQMSLTPSEDIAIYINWIGGDEDPSAVTGDSIKSFKHMVDLTASFVITEAFTVGINGAYGFYNFDTLKTKNWGGAALYLNYTMSDNFALGFRSEFFDDVSGAQYLGAAYAGFTVTGIITAANGHLLIKPEIRFDSSNDDIYYKGDSGSVTGNQTTLGIAFIGKF